MQPHWRSSVSFAQVLKAEVEQTVNAESAGRPSHAIVEGAIEFSSFVMVWFDRTSKRDVTIKFTT